MLTLAIGMLMLLIAPESTNRVLGTARDWLGPNLGMVAGSLAILLANVVAATADGPFNRDKCIAAGGTEEFCSKERVKPHEMGWWCDRTTDPPTAVRAEGGLKHKRDLAYCKPPEMGWLCDLTTDPPTVVRAEGGAKHKRDALAVCSSK